MRQSRLSLLIALAAVGGGAWAADDSSSSSSSDLQPLISQGDRLLAAGQYGEAARTYSDAIEMSPGQYLLYYKRATAYFSQNRHAPALDDFDTVLSLTQESGSFGKAHLMKGKIFAREGRWSEARDSLSLYATKAKTDTTTSELLFGVSEGELCTPATHSISLRQMRADCSLASGDIEQAAADLTRLTLIAPPSTAMYTRLASLTAQAMNHSDPDSKACLSAHRELKKFDKLFAKLNTFVEGSMWASVIKHTTHPEDGLAAQFDAALKSRLAADVDSLPAPEVLDPLKSSARRNTIYTAACRAFVESGQIKKSEPWCEELLRMDPESVDGWTSKAELALAKEDYEEAVRAFDRAFESSGRQQGSEIHQKLARAQRLLKLSKAKDYYKVIGVSRDADVREIKKAYRRAAMKAHPDKAGGSEAQMAAVNEAYEVLSDPEMRARFDNGEDPMDPASQQHGGHPFQQGGGHPFQMFFQQQQGGGGQHFQWSG
ncbi:hypothetical protein BKA62DRAFT_710172 [Auriculariales sp. MPI-PUGE-AT-0066]|nr:hypothetical protein BKA62DRAFT_710172 [Auriculariales sp. MPI-PUGE-AT-0066]